MVRFHPPSSLNIPENRAKEQQNSGIMPRKVERYGIKEEKKSINEANTKQN